MIGKSILLVGVLTNIFVLDLEELEELIYIRNMRIMTFRNS